MLLQVILEGIGLGVLLILVCAIGIRKGAVGMVHLYSPEVQERCVTLGLTTHAKIKRNALIFKASAFPVISPMCWSASMRSTVRKGLCSGLLADARYFVRYESHGPFFVDDYWVGHTNAWTIPGTEDLKPYITAKDKQKSGCSARWVWRSFRQHWRQL